MERWLPPAASWHAITLDAVLLSVHVHMLLIFYLGRPDVMPTGDFAIRLAFKQLYRKRRDPLPELILRHARCWQPWRSVASWYLWRHLDTR